MGDVLRARPSPDPILLIIPGTPLHGADGLGLLRSLELLGVPTLCFAAKFGARPNVLAGPGDGNIRWADHEPALRWLALRSLLDHSAYQAVGFDGLGTFEAFSERVDDHAEIPAFLYLQDKDLDAFIRGGNRRIRNLRHFRLVLLSNHAAVKTFEKIHPGPRPFHLASLDEPHLWRSFLRPQRKKKPTLSTIITPVHNRIEYTTRCIRNVTTNTAAPFEWVVIDNGSTDGTHQTLSRLARKDRRIRLLRNAANLGFARAVNQGLRKARGHAIVWLNNDTLVPPGWLEGLTSCLDHDPGLGAVGPCTNEAADLHQYRKASYRLDHFDAFATAWAMRHAGHVRQMPRLIGFCMAIRRGACDQVGLLDERFPIGGYEDYDYCLRLRQAGWRLGLAEEVFIHHFGHVSYSNAESRSRIIAANREIFVEKWARKSLEFLDNLSELKDAPLRG